MSRELGIIFTGDNVLKVRDGRKTQTRRIIKLDSAFDWSLLSFTDGIAEFENQYGHLKQIKPRYQVGDRLWVRECFAYLQDPELCANHDEFPDIAYKAGGQWEDAYPDEQPCWKSSRFMPKWAARTWLTVTAVRAELLQDISVEDCICEGSGYKKGEFYNNGFIDAFEERWDSIHGKGAWERNCWVWVYEIKLIKDCGV